jgi:putative ABC transport system permease protein
MNNIPVMIHLHIKSTFRNLLKNKVYTAVNVGGLTIGLATGLLVLLWVQDELSFDNYHPSVERIFRENAHLKIRDNQLNLTTCPAPHAAYALREIPEVEKAVRVVRSRESALRTDLLTGVEQRGAFADTSFFEVFKTAFLAGNPQMPFTGPNSVILTEQLASRYFGNNTPWQHVPGKVLYIDQEPMVVSAVIDNFPDNTQLQYDYLRPYEYLKQNFRASELWSSREEDWGNCDDATFFRLREGASAAVVAQKLGALTHAHNPLDRGSYYSLQPLTETRLYGPDGTEQGAKTVRIFGMAALFIILIACINYINLATARAAKRAREVGVRKTIGASRGQLVAQFGTESAVVFLAAFMLASGLVSVVLPWANALTGKTLSPDFSNPDFWWLMAGLPGAALVAGALYPALVLSGFKPVQVLNGVKYQGRDQSARIRQSLVVLQFVCSGVLILAMFVAGRQLHFIQNTHLGYDREHVFEIDLSATVQQKREAFMQELASAPGVRGVAAASTSLLDSRVSTGDVTWEGQTSGTDFKISPIGVTANLLPFFNMTLVAGSNFSGTTADAGGYILNETAVRQMGLPDPVGKRMTLWERPGVVLGVVKDFHFSSFHSAIKPAVFYVNPDRLSQVCVKTTAQDAQKALAAAAVVWGKYDAGYPFDYTFMDDTFHKMYERESRVAAVFSVFGVAGMLLSCLGLFGLTAFTLEQRTREIGIRKVMGASVAGITRLFAADFLKLVFISIVIATPLAYYFMGKWLADFAYRIELQAWMFVAVGALVVVLALLTVSVQSVRAALADPVKSLRD